LVHNIDVKINFFSL